MGLTFDQKVQLWNTIGTWFAGIAAVGAIVTSLFLATRTSRVRLRTNASVWVTIGEPGAGRERVVSISATNVGERPVTITNVGWRIGRWRNKRYCVQLFTDHISDRTPCEIVHGKGATFRVSLSQSPEWPSDFRNKFVRGAPLSTLRALISTSVGVDVEVKPSSSILDMLKG